MTSARQAPPEAPTTSAPLTEDERHADWEAADDRPFPWALSFGILALIAIAVVAGFAVGAQYAIPVAVLALVIAIFLGVTRGLAWSKTQRYGDRAAERAAADGSDAVPHLGFDDTTDVGDSDQVSSEQQASHDDMERSASQ